MRQKIESASSASHTSLGADAAEKNGRWLVGGVLGNQAALEGALEDGLAEGSGAIARNCESTREVRPGRLE